MFATMKQIFNPKNKDLRKRIYFTFFCLFIFKLGTTIIVPGSASAPDFENLGFLGLINAMGGGAMENASIFSLGVMPYITASIVIQLLQMDIVPYLAELSKQGGTGRAKLNQITRVTGIALAFFQGYIFSFSVVQNGTPIEYMEVALILTAGTAFLLWLGDQITTKGIGNGISLIIMAGIIASLPTMFITAAQSLIVTTSMQTLALGIAKFIILIVLYLAIIVGVVFEQTAERRIPIQYANRTVNSIGANNSYIPFKLNSAGVVPVIFASAILSIPTIIVQFLQKGEGSFALFVSKWLSMESVTGFILFIIFIVGFAYFYTYLQLKPKELAENLNKNGGFIPGIRPGVETEKYVGSVLNKITIVGAIFLAFIAGLPMIFGNISGLPVGVQLGGTGLLIVVGVALESYKQLESQLVSRQYKRGRRR